MKYLNAAIAALLCTAGFASAEMLYDSGGFESFAPGALDAQDAWTAGSTAGGTAPVVFAGSPAIGQQAVRLAVGDTQGDASTMTHLIPTLTGADLENSIVTVQYDIHRQGAFLQNMWWWWLDAGTPTYGLQWDAGPTLPNGWNPGAGQAATVQGRYATIKMVWDFSQDKAFSWYDGNLVDNGLAITDITVLTGWQINFAHESGSGTGADVAYIDNFSISREVVPEPASLGLLALGLGLVLRRR